MQHPRVRRGRAASWAVVLACAAATATAAGQGAAAVDESRPNLVFVFSDQHSSDMLGCYGNRDIHTPSLDRFAAAGVRFDHGISNSPVCTPYRGILLSGQHPLRTGALANDIRMLPGGGSHFGEVLRDAGYRTGYFGKWHLYGGDRERGVPPGPFRYGFDHEFLTNNCTLVFDAARAFYWSQDGRDRLHYGDWEPDAQARQAIEFIDRNADRPFALFLSWHPPHNWGRAHEGYDAPQDLLDLYDPATLTLRPTVEDTPAVRRAYQGHMAMISGLDRAFGRLLEALERHGLADDTIVVFTSDHGDMLGSYGWQANKGRAESLSCRVPLVLRWPAGLPPGRSDLLVGTFDLMPTLLGLMGLPVPESCQGRDASPALLAGCDDAIDGQPLFFLPMNWRGVYTRRYTYSETLHDSDDDATASRRAIHEVLYDRELDPAETTNRFHDPEYAEVRAALHAKTHGLMERYEDSGIRYSELLEMVIRPEDLADLRLPPGRRPPGWEARPKGRPVDLVKVLGAAAEPD